MNDWWRQRAERLWEESETLTRAQRALRITARYLAVLARDLMEGQLSMRAMSLVYTSLLSVVPLLALSFSVLKALGVHNSLEPVLLRVLEPLGPQSVEISEKIISFVENIKVGVLGSLGVGLLLFAVISLIQKIEASFNFIWRIERARRFSQRFSEYLSVLIAGPLLVFTAVGVTAAVLNSSIVARIATLQPFGFLIYTIGRLLPYALIIGLFTFLYAFMPNTRVRGRAALAGGLLAGVLWQSASLGFAQFAAGATNYNAIYSSFAILIFLLIWLYLGWLILLTGCQLSFYVQHPEYLRPTRIAPYLSARGAELIGLAIVGLVGRRFIAGEPPQPEAELARQLSAPPDHVNHVIEVLMHQDVLARAIPGPGLLLARDPDSLTVADLWQRIRRGFDSMRKPGAERTAGAGALVDEAEQSFAQSAGAQTLRQWLAR